MKLRQGNSHRGANVRMKSQTFTQFVGVNVGVSASRSTRRQVKSIEYMAYSADVTLRQRSALAGP